MARFKDPVTGQLLPEGVRPVVSERTGKVTYRARVSYGSRENRRYLGKTCNTAAEAVEWRYTNQIKINRGQMVEPSKLTVQDYYERWYVRHTNGLSGARALDIASVWKTHGAEVIGSMRLQAVTRSHIQALADRMLETVSPNSQKTYMAMFRSLFASAVDEAIIDTNPCTGVKLGRVSVTRITVWSPLQLRRFLAGTRNHQYGPIWAFMIATACRSGEARALQWDAVDIGRGTAWIRRTFAKSVERKEVIKERTKNSNDGHEVRLEPWIVDVLAGLPRTGKLVFTEHGESIAYDKLRRAFHAESERLGLPAMKLHGLRHSTITMLVSSGVSDAVSRSITGQSLMTLLKDYAHVNVDAQRIGTETMAKLLGFDASVDTTTLQEKEAIS